MLGRCTSGRLSAACALLAAGPCLCRVVPMACCVSFRVWLSRCISHDQFLTTSPRCERYPCVCVSAQRPLRRLGNFCRIAADCGDR